MPGAGSPVVVGRFVSRMVIGGWLLFRLEASAWGEAKEDDVLEKYKRHDYHVTRYDVNVTGDGIEESVTILERVRWVHVSLDEALEYLVEKGGEGMEEYVRLLREHLNPGTDDEGE